MDDHFWLDFDIRAGKASAVKGFRTCPACLAVWEGDIDFQHLVHAVIECPTCQTLSVGDRRFRLWPRRSCRRIVEDSRGGE